MHDDLPCGLALGRQEVNGRILHARTGANPWCPQGRRGLQRHAIAETFREELVRIERLLDAPDAVRTPGRRRRQRRRAALHPLAHALVAPVRYEAVDPFARIGIGFALKRRPDRRLVDHMGKARALVDSQDVVLDDKRILARRNHGRCVNHQPTRPFGMEVDGIALDRQRLRESPWRTKIRRQTQRELPCRLRARIWPARQRVRLLPLRVERLATEHEIGVLLDRIRSLRVGEIHPPIPNIALAEAQDNPLVVLIGTRTKIAIANEKALFRRKDKTLYRPYVIRRRRQGDETIRRRTCHRSDGQCTH